MRYLWIPGQGPDPAALARMAAAFPRPDAPMGEAWFMTDQRRMYPELLGELGQLSVRTLQRPLTDIASGPACFGRLREWTDWQHYLLPRLIPRRHEIFVTALLELLVTGFMAVHPDGAGDDIYRGFREDVLNTLGRSLMDADCWPDGGFNADLCLDRAYVERVDRWFWDEPSGKLSASLFLCLKYLHAHEVGPWLESVLAIPNRRWRAQMLAWMVGAHGLLTGRIDQPEGLPERYADGPHVGWDWSQGLSGNYSGSFDAGAATRDFLPEANRQVALATIRAVLTEDVFLGWLMSISENPTLQAELARIPAAFEALYLAPPRPDVRPDNPRDDAQLRLW